MEIECPACKKVTIPSGASVCTGCHGHVVWGATKEELTKAFAIGFTPWFLVSILVSQHFFGWSPLQFIASCGGGVVCGLIGRKIMEKLKSSPVRVFR